MKIRVTVKKSACGYQVKIGRHILATAATAAEANAMAELQQDKMGYPHSCYSPKLARV